MRKFIMIILLLLLIILYQCEMTYRLKSSQLENTTTISDTIKYYRNSLSMQIATAKTLELENHQVRSLLLKKDKTLAIIAAEFSKIHTITKYKSKIVIDTIRIRFKDSIPCIFNTSGKKLGNSYSFNYCISQKGIEIDSLMLPTQTTVITGIKKKWFFGPQVLTTDISNSNPYIKITRIESAEIIIKQPWYKKWYVWLIAGTACGWLTAK